MRHLLFIFLLLFSLQKAFALDEVEAEKFVNGLGDEFAELIQSNTTPETYLDGARQLLQEKIDIPIISQFLLGSYGRNLDAEIADEFRQVLEDYITLVYGLRLRAYYDGEILKADNVVEQNRTYLVHSRIISKDGENEIKVSWRLYEKEGKTKIIDIILGDVSMIISQRDEFTSIIRNNQGNVRALTKDMQAQAEKVSVKFLNQEW